MLPHSWKRINVLNFDVWEGIYKPDSKIMKGVHKLPLTYFIWKRGNLLYLQVREGFYNLHLDISKALYYLNFTAQLKTASIYCRNQKGRLHQFCLTN